jgi:Dolichyl-phosphate-mannose-protein mannosyltransferase
VIEGAAMTVIGMTSSERSFTSGRAESIDAWSLLALFLIVQTIAWVGVPAAIYGTPHSNTVELALWARDWFVVNYKHPALAAWLLGFGYEVFGTHLWVSFLLAELCIAAAYVFVFLLGRDLLGARAALFGALLLPAVSHFTLDALRYNHNVVQLPLWIGFCFALWRASRGERLGWWIFTGAIGALGLYAKFTMVLVILFGALWIVLDPEARARLRGRALYVGLLVFTVALLPLAMGLGATEFDSLTWVARESAQRGIAGAHFLLDVGKTVLFMAVGLAGGMAASRIPPRRKAPELQPAIAHRGLVFLLLMGGGPLLLTLAMALTKPMRLEWAAPMYSMIGLLLVALMIRVRPRAGRWMQAGLRHAVLGLVASLTVLGLQASSTLHDRAVGLISKNMWPSAEIAARFDGVWQNATGRPLRIVAGSSWTAGMVGLLSAGHPSLFTDLNPELSPAVTEPRLEQEGMLVLWIDDTTWHPDAALIARFPHGRESFTVGPKAVSVVVNYLLVAPGRWSDADWDQWVEPDEAPAPPG